MHGIMQESNANRQATAKDTKQAKITYKQIPTSSKNKQDQ